MELGKRKPAEIAKSSPVTTQRQGKERLELMKDGNWHWKRMLASVVMISVGFTFVACGGGEGPIVPPPPAPPEYADKHMPPEYWSDPKIIEEGRQIFIGAENIDVNCASCHGKDGKPKKAGARDFRVAERMKLYSDSVWLWRVSEGVPNTKMKAWKTKLSEDDRWKVIAYERTFGLDGLEYDPGKKDWVPIGTAGQASEDGAPPAEGDAGADGAGEQPGGEAAGTGEQPGEESPK